MPDPRLYQIAVLVSLLVYGMGWFGFDISPARAGLILATVLVRGRTSGARGAATGVAHRLAGDRHPQEDGARRRGARAGGMVATHLEVM